MFKYYIDMDYTYHRYDFKDILIIKIQNLIFIKRTTHQ